MTFKQKWDLDCFYAGGSDSTALKEAFFKTDEKLGDLDRVIRAKSDLKKALQMVQDIRPHLHEIEHFIICLAAQNTSDTKAHFLQNQTTALNAKFENLLVALDEWLTSLDQKTFANLIEDPDIKPIAFSIKERRQIAQDKLPFKYESLINDLAVDGFHGWTQMWEALLGTISFPFETESLSFGQIENQLASPIRAKRETAFQGIDKALRDHQNLFAQILNHLAGFRLTIYQKREWNSVLKYPLENNRMQEKTVESMWKAVKKHREKLTTYLACKADLLGIPNMEWWDLEAPLGEVKKRIPYSEACTFIIKHFTQFSPKMGSFANRVLNGEWIDAENRAKKSPGGFCVGMPIAKQSRILMTYADTMTNVFTLAHEIGHAFHNEVIFPLKEMNQSIRMSVAESASTMAEIVVTRAAIEEASNERERLFILDDHLSRSVSYLMNIHARFLFEINFYQERKKGFVSPERLNEMMGEAQKEAYANSLGTYHPLFWTAKMHFYFADIAFYNFPYTFGYLFSLGTYEIAKKEGKFEETYISLLKDTGQMSVEDLAKKHLNADLTHMEFWEIALQTIDQDIDDYLSLAKKHEKTK